MRPRKIPESMKLLLALLLVFPLSPALAQHRHQGQGNQQQQRPMPPPDRRMAWDERQRLREQVRGGQMSREEARQHWQEQRGREPGRFSPEQREQLRRDVNDANRDLQRR
jgi:hypothetical protein